MSCAFNPKQGKAIKAPTRPLLIVAGAGTGKTRTLTHRLAHLIADGISGNLICALTFTNKAAKEMRGRLEALARDKLPGRSEANVPFVGTFHSLGVYILKREAAFFGRTSRFGIYDDDDGISVIKKILRARPGRAEISPFSVREFIHKVKNGSVAPARGAGDKKEEELFDLYEKALEDQNAFDLDDLIFKPVQGFGRSQEMLARYNEKFKYFLVDEYQDINPAQYELIRFLVGENGHLTVVGDEDQTIYSWRGSTIDTFLNFKKDWPDSQVILLREHYRSTSNIVEAATAVVAKNTRRLSLGDKRLFTRNPQGSLIRIAEFPNEKEEAIWINEKAKNIHRGDSVAVLYRTNAQSRAIEQEFLERGAPYKILGGLRFYDRREVKDVLAALRYAYNPRDEVSKERLKKTFFARLFPKIEERILGAAGGSPAEAIEVFLAVSEYPAYLIKHFANAEERKENIIELLNFSREFHDLGEFLEHASLVQATDSPSAETIPRAGRPFVNLMTIHMAKGLEFDHVFISGCAEGLLPHARAFSPLEIEEERRLIYVAMTRAKKELNISFFGIPSRFIAEIPERLISFETSSLAALGLDSEERYITYD